MKIKLANNHTYNLITNGVQEAGKVLKLLFQPGEETFEEIEKNFTEQENTCSIYVLDNESQPIRSLIDYTKYKGMEKIVDYLISTEMVNMGTELSPDYQESNTYGPVMIVTMSKPEIEDRVETLENDMINTMLALTELYEGGLA